MENQQLENLIIEHIKKYRENPVAACVFDGSSSFHGQVEEYYNFNNKEPDSQKKGQTPQDLIEIVAPLSEETIDKSLLQYDTVRESKRKYLRGGLIELVAVSGLIGLGLPLALVSDKYGNNLLAYIGVGSFALGTISMAVLSEIEDKIKDPVLKEYDKLYWAAYKADGLVEKIREPQEANL